MREKPEVFTMKAIILGSIIAIAASTHAAPAKANKTLCYKAHGIREAVVDKHGPSAPGRNICRTGNPTTHEKAVYVRDLKRLSSPAPPYLTKVAGPPKVGPADTMTPHYRPVGTAACIVKNESGGNPDAQNGQYEGIAQWSQEAWERHGGLKYAPTPLAATYKQQLFVLSRGLTKFGCRDWCQFDPC